MDNTYIVLSTFCSVITTEIGGQHHRQYAHIPYEACSKYKICYKCLKAVLATCTFGLHLLKEHVSFFVNGHILRNTPSATTCCLCMASYISYFLQLNLSAVLS